MRSTTLNAAEVILSALLGTQACGAPPPTEQPPVASAPVSETPSGQTSQSSAAERAEYLDRVALSGVKAHRGAGAVDGMAVIEGEIKNTGDRSLDQITLTIFFLNAQGRSVKEETYAPVMRLNTASGDIPPLKPNEKRGWSCGVGDVPENWAGTVNVKVADVEFSSAPH